jgi:putative membrane protein insertion efficiency factor
MIRKFFSNTLILFIRIYQYGLKPLFPSSCRHEPTCSHYAVEAVKRFGPTKGVALSAKRIAKCRPGGTFGYDPVPNPS